ncbi:TolC family protein [Poseidonibacter sp.]|uniref:TolC family protein n=1 Tax=Poseidonibacter sp. TaxID=2321188 RepID=UPI003C76B7E2
MKYGTIEGLSSITKYNNERTLAPLAPPIAPNVTTSDTLTTLGISYSVTLFSGFKDSSQIELSNIAKNIEQTKHNLTLAQLQFNVQSLFCDILSLDKTLLAWKKHQESIKKLYQFSEQEFNLGKKSQLELLKIESDLQDSNTVLIDLQTKIDILHHSLSLLIYGEKRDFTLENIEFETQDSNFSLDTLQKIYLASLNDKSKAKLLKSSQSAYYPKITFNTSYNNIYGDRI